jgi:hypothetical protein
MGVKIITSLPGLIFFDYDVIEFSPNSLGSEVEFFQKLVYET